MLFYFIVPSIKDFFGEGWSVLTNNGEAQVKKGWKVLSGIDCYSHDHPNVLACEFYKFINDRCSFCIPMNFGITLKAFMLKYRFFKKGSLYGFVKLISNYSEDSKWINAQRIEVSGGIHL